MREPLIDQETHKKMLAFYHKKTEEAKVGKFAAFILISWLEIRG